MKPLNEAQIVLRLPGPLKDRLQREADRQGMSLSNLVRFILDQALAAKEQQTNKRNDNPIPSPPSALILSSFSEFYSPIPFTPSPHPSSLSLPPPIPTHT